MKIFSKALCVAALAIAVAPFAKADSSIISFTGNDTYCTTSSSACGTAGTINFQDTKTGFGYGLFQPFSNSGTLSWISSFNYMTTATPFDLFTVASNAADELLTYTVTSLSYTLSGENLSITGDGYYSIYYAATGNTAEVATGSFNLTTQNGQENSTQLVTFSDTNTGITPEPNSLMLLGTGLVGAAGMLMRRRRVIA